MRVLVPESSTEKDEVAPSVRDFGLSLALNSKLNPETRDLLNWRFWGFRV